MAMSSPLSPASLLLGSSKSEQRQLDVSTVLRSRLAAFGEATGTEISTTSTSSLQDLQIETAKHALTVVEEYQRTLLDKPDTSFGAKDITNTHTLLTLVFTWGVSQLFTITSDYWQDPSRRHDEQLSDHISTLESLSKKLFSLLTSDDGSLKQQTLITSVLLSRHLADLLRIGLVLGWMPAQSIQVDLTDYFRPMALRIISALPPAESISALGKALTLKLPRYAHESCAKLMSQQLLRPNGVSGLMEVIFGGPDDANTEVPALPKLQHVARVINAVPSNSAPQDYFATVTPRVFSLLSTSAPASYRTAAAFTISSMLTSKSRHSKIVIPLVNSYLHDPWFQVAKHDDLGDDFEDEADTVHSSQKPSLQSPRNALLTLTLLLANVDPSPTLIADILSPIIPPLYGLYECFAAVKTVDPESKENLSNLLSTWASVVSMVQATTVIWKIVQGEAGFWKIDISGDIQRTEEKEPKDRLAMLTPEDVRRAAESQDDDVDSNFLDLKPNPTLFVKFISSLKNTDLSVWLLIKLLQEYRRAKASPDSDPLKLLVYLQILVQLQTSFIDQKTTLKVLKQPQQIVSFVKEVVDSAEINQNDKKEAAQSKHPKDPLKFIEHEDDEEELETFEEKQDAEDEILITSLTLLLAIFEANQELSARTFPELNDIFSMLEPLTQHPSDSVAQLARENRLIMTARLASSSSTSSVPPRDSREEDHQETYHKALRLLQDPILPVRAHGLLLLRQLVSGSQKNKVDEALIPAILSIFLQAAQDDDSYIFLNAVQGLSAMVDGYGKRLLSSLVAEYSGKLEGLGASNLTQRELDTRLRVGEALTQVIQRYGEALAMHVDVLVPPIAAVIRNSAVPTALRTSAISILSQAINTRVTSLLQYTPDLSEAMVDLLQVETAPASQRSTKNQAEPPEDDDAKQAETMDSAPISKNSKLPPLRRAALHFLSSLINSATHSTYSGDLTDILPSWTSQRARVTLGYVAAVDPDPVVQVMARESLEHLEQYNKAKLGL